MEFFLFFIISSLIFAVIAALIANSKGRSPVGWAVLGFFFSLIAILVIACLPSLHQLHRLDEETHQRRLAELEAARARADAARAVEPRRIETAANVAPEKKCPMCAELVKAEARICRFCGHSFEGQAAPARGA